MVQGDVLLVCYVADVASKMQIHSLDTGSKQREVALPGIGSVTQFAGKREDSEFFFGFSSFTEPGATYRCEFTSTSLSTQPRVFIADSGGVQIAELSRSHVGCMTACDTCGLAQRTLL